MIEVGIAAAVLTTDVSMHSAIYLYIAYIIDCG